MIYSLRGKLIKIENNFLVIECAGVGYKCLTSAYTQMQLSNQLNKEAIVYTYMNVRQDAVDLFGFYSEAELEYFKLLTSVSGVGPKAALSILSQFSTAQITDFVASGNSHGLTAASGIGAKTAQRIVLELKDKLQKISSSNSSSILSSVSPQFSTGNISEAKKALAALGYSEQDANIILQGADENASVQEIIKYALSNAAKGV